MSCPEDCPAGIVFLKPPFPSGAIGFDGSTMILLGQSAAICGDQLLDCIEVDRKDDNVSFVNGVGDRHRFGVVAKLDSEFLRFRQGLIGDDDLLATGG